MQKMKDGYVAWNIGKLEPKGSRTISVQAMATTTGALVPVQLSTYDVRLCQNQCSGAEACVDRGLPHPRFWLVTGYLSSTSSRTQEQAPRAM